MNEENLLMFSPEEIPQTDEPKKDEKIRINNLQENLIFLIEDRKISLAAVQKETQIPWPTLYGWYKGDVKVQMLDLNMKELANFFEISIESLAFDDLRGLSKTG